MKNTLHLVEKENEILYGLEDGVQRLLSHISGGLCGVTREYLDTAIKPLLSCHNIGILTIYGKESITIL